MGRDEKSPANTSAVNLGCGSWRYRAIHPDGLFTIGCTVPLMEPYSGATLLRAWRAWDPEASPTDDPAVTLPPAEAVLAPQVVWALVLETARGNFVVAIGPEGLEWVHQLELPMPLWCVWKVSSCGPPRRLPHHCSHDVVIVAAI